MLAGYEAPFPTRQHQAGARIDGRDLTAEWLTVADDRRYVWNADQLDALDPAAPGVAPRLAETFAELAARYRDLDGIHFADYIGQERVRENLHVSITAARQRGDALDVIDL